MASSKSNLQYFQSSWSKTVSWAHSQGIPQASIYPVYQLDSKRLLSGYYPMSEAERTRAILASYNPNNVTPLPSDKPGNPITGFFGNVMHDAENIFTGLQPTKLIPSLFDSVKNTFEHPEWLLNPEKNTLASFIPGDQLLAMYKQGGFSELAAHPLLSFLNVLPVADVGTSLLAKTAVGDVLARAAGLEDRTAVGASLGQHGVGPLTLARKMVGNRPTGTIGITMGEDGLPQIGQLTLHQKLKNWSNIKGLGSDIAGIGAKVHAVTQQASAKSLQILGDFATANAKLTPEEAREAYDIVTKSGKTYDQIRTDVNIDPKIKNMVSVYEDLEHFMEETELAAGTISRVQMADGSFEVYSSKDAAGVIGARDRLDKAVTAADTALAKAEKIGASIERNDTVAKPALAQLATLGGQIKQAIKGTLSDPNESRDELRDRLRGVLPKEDAFDRLGVNRDNLQRILGVPKVTLTQARLMQEIFGPNGLVEQIADAYQKGDFQAFRDLSKTLNKRLKNQALATPALDQMRTTVENIFRYGQGRQKEEVEFSKATGGRFATAADKAKFNRVVQTQAKAEKDFLKAVHNNPARRWQPLYVNLVNQRIAQDERGALAVDEAMGEFAKNGTPEETLKQLRSDPSKVIAIIRTYASASTESPFAGMLDVSLVKEMQDSAATEIESLRARGETPHYVPNFSSRDSLGGYEPGEASLAIRIPSLTRYSSVDAAKDALLDQSNTIYDIFAGTTKTIKQELTRDATAEVIDEYIIPRFGYKQSDLEPLLRQNHPTLGAEAGHGSEAAYFTHILESTYGMAKFDPKSMFGVSSTKITGDDTIWMPKAVLDGLRDVVDKSQFDPTGTLAGATRIFRTAILGYSPRFVAHIFFGGSFLMALRNPGAFLHMGEALQMIRDPEKAAAIHATSTQRGYEDPVSAGVIAFHHAGGRQLGGLWAQEMMAKLNLDPSKMTSWLKVIPQMTFRLTNVMTDMQRAMTYLDGAAKASKIDRYLDPETDKMVEMTPERAHEMGMRAANRVLSDLSHMTPLERNTLTTVIPFYGWTKHILQYVAQYPVDHPYRAMALANLATMDSDEVSKGLYTRIQNLFFLGAPDTSGNVSALDVRFLNPLRDVANYATLSGMISMLNPAITALPAMVDPSIVFGNNTLYPNLTYSSLYGTKEAAPSGNVLNAVEQFIPQVSALDAALGLSAQYRNERTKDPAAFAKTIFQALNIPFGNVQHLNLRQIAAQQEIDRYAVSSANALSAFQTGDFSSIGNVASVPNPLQTDYNISPTSLEDLYKETLAKTGLPPSEVLPSLPAPVGL